LGGGPRIEALGGDPALEQALSTHDTMNRQGGDSYDELKRRLGI
jgi:hypothetical protein